MSQQELETLLILLFGLKLVKVRCPEWTYVTDLLDNILQSGEYDLSDEILTLMKTFKPRHLRYSTLRRPYPIDDLDKVPTQLDPGNLDELDTDFGLSTECTFGRLPNDGSCLNLVVEQPLSIQQLEGGDRFRSREIILFLREYDVEVYPRGQEDSKIGSGWMHDTEPIWCKIVPEREVQVLEKLKEHDPDSHHVAKLIIPPYLLPTGDYLITMPFYGEDLTEILRRSRRSSLAGPVILKLAHQLCTAISFLHSRNMYHLDIKPENIVVDEDKDSKLTVIDLGWVMSARQPCSVWGATGTRHYAPPEVQLWYEWEDERKSDGSADRPRPPKYNPRKADAWAIGNVVTILVDTVLDEDENLENLEVDHSEELYKFATWMMDKRPRIEVALKRLNWIATHYGVPRTPSPVDSAVHVSP
ncbi:hypothetical protein AAF712_003288 [Marasmius tenuissimus]|uniref:Protein kinase domain-containing protein n=1 Tax=Marasmius tenuissimus TaxID=585030 RepID=A0ABR3A6N5_9AGAR